MRVQVRNRLLTGVVIFSLIFLAGCGTLETLINKDANATSLGDLIIGDKTASLPVSAGVSIGQTDGTAVESKTIALYFADSTGKYLLEEKRVLPKTVSLARETVTQWLKGPAAGKGSSLLAPVSAATKLLDIGIKDSVATVDLSKEFLQPNSGVSPEVALYGLVNTLTQFPTVKQVQIRIEGQPLSRYGTLDATQLVNKAGLLKGAVSGGSVFPSSTSGTDNSAGGSTGSNLGNSNSSGSNGTNDNPESSTTENKEKVLPNSPSSVNLFNYPPSST